MGVQSSERFKLLRNDVPDEVPDELQRRKRAEADTRDVSNGTRSRGGREEGGSGTSGWFGETGEYHHHHQQQQQQHSFSFCIVLLTQ